MRLSDRWLAMKLAMLLLLATVLVATAVCYAGNHPVRRWCRDVRDLCRLRRELTDDKQWYPRRDAESNALDRVRQKLGRFDPSRDPDTLTTRLTHELATTADTAGCRLAGLRSVSAPAPAAPHPPTTPRQQRYEIVIAGQFWQLHRFLTQLDDYPVIVRIDSIALRAPDAVPPQGSPELIATLLVTVFEFPPLREVKAYNDTSQPGYPFGGGSRFGPGTGGGNGHAPSAPQLPGIFTPPPSIPVQPPVGTGQQQRA